LGCGWGCVWRRKEMQQDGSGWAEKKAKAGGGSWGKR